MKTYALVAGVAANLGLLVLALLSAPVGLGYAMASDGCSTDEPLICTSNGQGLAMMLPPAASGLGFLVGTAACWACWAWSRRWSFAFMATGYAIALAGYIAGYVVASGAD
jgi:hypothetical protein